MSKENKIKKDKKEAKFRRKINAICIDFRFYSKAKKNTIIEPCVNEYRRQVLEGVSPKSATKEIKKSCRETLERKHEKHNKFLSLLIFSFVFSLFVFALEWPIFSNVLYDTYNNNTYVIWGAAVIGLFLIFIIWSGLTHNGRGFNYFFSVLYMIIYAASMAMIIYFTYYAEVDGCLQNVWFVNDEPFMTEIRQYVGTLDSSGVCKDAILVSTQYANLDVCGSLIIFVISIILYLAEHARLNVFYSRNKINNLCTQYGINKGNDRKEIRDGALESYYSYIDEGKSKKNANKLVTSETAELLSRDHKKHCRLSFAFAIVLIFFIYAAYEYVSIGMSLIYEVSFFDSIFYVAIGAMFVFGLLLILMLFMPHHFYWYDYVIVGLILASILVAGLFYFGFSYSHFDPPDAGQITYEAGAFYFIKIMETFEETYASDGSIIYNPAVIVSTSESYLPMIDAGIAIIFAIIIIPSFSCSYHKIKKARKKKELENS